MVIASSAGDFDALGGNLDVDAVYRNARVLDPKCSVEAVSEYVREINEMAGELYSFALGEATGAADFLSFEQKSNGQ